MANRRDNVRIAAWALAALLASGAASPLAAKTVVWDDSSHTGEWNTAVDNWSGIILYADGDSVQFTDASPTGAIFIGSGGSPQNVSPNSIYFHMYGRTWTFSGGDILTGSVLMDWDSTVYFDQPGSLSFAGGTSITHPNARMYYRPGGGTHHFGTGAITLSGGFGNGPSFRFEPTAAAVLTNEFITEGSGNWLSGNANASFTGQVTLKGPIRISGRNIFNNTFKLDGGDRAIHMERHYDGSLYCIFNGNVDGAGVYSVTLADGTSSGSVTDWRYSIQGTGGWNVKNVVINSPSSIVMLEADEKTFFNGVKANGGKVIVQQGFLAKQSGHGGNMSGFGGDYYVTCAYEVRGTGRLIANNIYVQDGGSVGGDGTVHGKTAVTVADATVAPGMSIGTLNVVGNLLLGPATVLNFDFGPAGACDLLSVTGNLRLDGTLNVLDAGLEAGTYTFITYTGSLMDNGLDVTMPTGWEHELDTATAGEVNLVVREKAAEQLIPEPATVALLATGAAGVLGRRRRTG